MALAVGMVGKCHIENGRAVPTGALPKLQNQKQKHDNRFEPLNLDNPNTPFSLRYFFFFLVSVRKHAFYIMDTNH